MAEPSRGAAVSGEARWHPKHNPWLIAVAVMTATFMEVLDTSVANVALPHIAGNLSVTTEQATWVLTSYLVSNAIVLPMTGWLGTLLGRRRLLVICISLFTAASVLCGMAPDIQFLIIARILQGVGGGALIPISQAVLLESFPPQKIGVAMATFGMGVVVAPILGPTLGGWITDNYSWRWIFYINLPVGIFAVFMVQALVEDPPYLQMARERIGSIDFMGFGLLAVWLATLQIILDKGQQADWWNAEWVRWFGTISLFCLVGFIIRELRTAHPIVDLRVLKNRNFTAGILLMTSLGAVLYGTTAALPIFLQTMMGYPALQSGLALSPRGLGAFIMNFVVGRLVGHVRNRALIATGFTLLAISSFWLGHINLEVSMESVVLPTILNGVAMSFIFTPLTAAAMGYLRQDQMANATGIYNLMRNLGGSLGIALVSTLIVRRAQVHHGLMVSHLTPYDPVYAARVADLTQALTPATGEFLAHQQAQALVYATLERQATLWAFVENFRWFGLLCLACIPMVLLFKKAPASKRKPMPH